MKNPFVPCFPSGIRDFPFTPEQIRDIWRLAKRDFIDKGSGIAETIRGLSDKLSIAPYHVAQALTKPKTIPRLQAMDAWVKTGARRRTIAGAKSIVVDAQRSPILAKLDALYNIPRSLKVVGHWGVFTLTHGGDFLFIPSEWGRFIPQWYRGWRAVSPNFFDKAVENHLKNIPEHDAFTAAGLDNDPYGHALGIFKAGNTPHKSGSWTKPGPRGFGTIALARDVLAKNLWDRVKRIDPTAGKDQMRAVMTQVNHVWGSVRIPAKAGPWMSRLIFATKLLPARLMSTFVDMPKAINTAAHWRTATAAERVTALFQARRLAQVLLVHHTLVAANAAYNQMFGNDKVNLTDPSRVGDWMAFKIGGLTIRPPSAILEAERLLAGFIYASIGGSKKTAGDVVKDYIGGKLNPAIHLAQEVTSGVNWTGERLPFKGIAEHLTGHPPKDNFGRPITKKEPLGEFVAERSLPIPFGGAAREVYEIFKHEGLRSEEAGAWMRALSNYKPGAVGGIESMGMTAHETFKYKPTGRNKLAKWMHENTPILGQ